MRAGRRRLAAAAIVTTLAAITVTGGMVHRQRELGRDSVVERSEALYRKIVLQPTSEPTVLSRGVTYSSANMPVSHDFVEVGGGAAGSVALDWNGDTGELMSASSHIGFALYSALPLLTPEKAAQSGSLWLESLGVAALDPAWKLVKAPRHVKPDVYEMKWLSGRREVRLIVHARSGELIRADIMHRKGPEVLAENR